MKSGFVIGGTRRGTYYPYKRKPVDFDQARNEFRFDGKVFPDERSLLSAIEADLSLITKFNPYLNKVIDDAYAVELSRDAKTGVDGCLASNCLHIIKFSRDEDDEGIHRIHHLSRLYRRINYRLSRAEWFRKEVGNFGGIWFYSLISEINF